jgi:large subunit ribosomal protein L3
MIGRKVGMMRLYDGAGRSRGVTVIELGPNYVTQIRTPERDGYSAVQLGYPGKRKRANRPERGHLRAAGLEGRSPVLTRLREFRLNDSSSFELGQTLTVERFEPGSFVDVTSTSKGKGFAGGVKRWGFAGGPKTHGQSDRHRAPGSIGSGTTPGRVYKGLKMAGHMGSETVSVLNLLVVAVDPTRNLLFVEGSVPGHKETIVTVGLARRPALKDYTPPVITGATEADEADEAPEVVEDEAEETTNAEAVAETAAAPVAEATTEEPAAEAETTEAAPEAEASTEDAPADEAAADDENKSEA